MVKVVDRILNFDTDKVIKSWNWEKVDSSVKHERDIMEMQQEMERKEKERKLQEKNK